MSNPKYRPDIDGLRSLAILPVLFYHAGIPGFSGGFVGVDVFFVISGFLITSILAREFSNHSYSIASFYERRIRRIFPALLVVLVFVLAASPFVLLPSEFSSLGRDAASAIFFVANINFWRQSGYFASDAEAKPLLHMWSLGVEEQFYLIAPLALYLALRFAPRYRLLLVGAAAVGSFVLCVYLTPTKPSAAFYLLPTRAWELLVGSWLALWLADRPSTGSVPASRKQSFAGLFGVALIIFAVFAYSKATSFPGYAALAPVLGSALLIYSGQNTVTGCALSWRPLVGIGLISFSLYLWHWPILVIFRNLGWLNSWAGALCAITASVAAAWATWRWVETPTRDRRLFPTRRIAISTMAMTLAVLSTCAVYATLSGWPSRVSKEVLAFDEARNDRSPERERCHADGGLPDPRRACVLGAGGATAVAVWGDSHGVELAQALGEQGLPVQEITYSSCPPALNLKAKGDRPFCQQHNNQVFDYLVNNASIETVVLAAYYGFPLSKSADLQLHLADTANALTAAGKRVVIVGPYVSIDGHVDVPTHLARGGDRKVPFDGDGISVLRQRIGPSVQLVSPINIFCRDGYCDLIRDGLPLYFDAHHPSMHASRVVARGVLPLISVGSNH